MSTENIRHPGALRKSLSIINCFRIPIQVQLHSSSGNSDETLYYGDAPNGGEQSSSFDRIQRAVHGGHVGVERS